MHSRLIRQLELLGLSADLPPNADGWHAALERLSNVLDIRDEERKALTSSQEQAVQMFGNSEHHGRNFQMLVERSPSPIFVNDATSAVLYANQRMASLLGYASAKDLIGVLSDTFVYREDLPALNEYRKRHAAHEADVGATEVRWIRRDGQLVIISGESTPIMFEGVPARLTTVIDITERRKIETERDAVIEALRVSEERYRALFDGGPLAVMVFDPQTLAILTVNEAALRLYGYTREEFLEKKLSELKVDKDDVDLKAQTGAFPDVKTTPFWRGTKTHIRKDGAHIELDITSHDVTVSGRRAVLSLVSDLTEKRRLEEQLRQSQKMEAVGRLAGGVAHDFNNILAVILADTDFVKEELGIDHPLGIHLDEVSAAAERAAALTHQLLAFSRRQVLKPRVLALNAVVTDMDRMLRRLIGEDVVLEMKLDPTLGAVMADPGQLEQVIMNLVVNARDAMPGGGGITVHTQNVEVLEGDRERPVDFPPGAYVASTVADTGCGMEASTITRIFEPFFTTKGVGRGTGLGLSTVFGIIQQSGGFIHVTSAPGEGASFRVSLPRVDDHAALITRKSAKEVTSRGDELVLLVEDDPHVRRAATRALQRRGYNVIEAGSGEEALERFSGRENKIDLVVTDLVMPGLDGVQVAARLRREHGLMRVLYMSGYVEHAVLRDGELGASAPFLQKPFSADELASAVRSVLDAAVPVERPFY